MFILAGLHMNCLVDIGGLILVGPNYGLRKL